MSDTKGAARKRRDIARAVFGPRERWRKSEASRSPTSVSPQTPLQGFVGRHISGTRAPEFVEDQAELFAQDPRDYMAEVVFGHNARHLADDIRRGVITSPDGSIVQDAQPDYRAPFWEDDANTFYQLEQARGGRTDVEELMSGILAPVELMSDVGMASGAVGGARAGIQSRAGASASVAYRRWAERQAHIDRLASAPNGPAAAVEKPGSGLRRLIAPEESNAALGLLDLIGRAVADEASTVARDVGSYIRNVGKTVKPVARRQPTPLPGTAPENVAHLSAQQARTAAVQAVKGVDDAIDILPHVRGVQDAVKLAAAAPVAAVAGSAMQDTPPRSLEAPGTGLLGPRERPPHSAREEPPPPPPPPAEPLPDVFGSLPRKSAGDGWQRVPQGLQDALGEEYRQDREAIKSGRSDLGVNYANGRTQGQQMLMERDQQFFRDTDALYSMLTGASKVQVEFVPTNPDDPRGGGEWWVRGMDDGRRVPFEPQESAPTSAQAGTSSTTDIASIAPDPTLIPAGEIDPRSPDHVRQLQTALNDAAPAVGAEPLPVTGNLLQLTRASMAKVAAAYGVTSEIDPTTAYRLAIAYPRKNATVQMVQRALLQNPELGGLLGEARDDNWYGPATKTGIETYTGQPAPQAAADFRAPPQEWLNELYWGRIMGNTMWREQMAARR